MNPTIYNPITDKYEPVTQEDIDVLLRYRNAYLSIVRDATVAVTLARSIADGTHVFPDPHETKDVSAWVKERDADVKWKRTFADIVSEKEIDDEASKYVGLPQNELEQMANDAYQAWSNEVSVGRMPSDAAILKMNGLQAEVLRRTKVLAPATP